jgi:hypothetical protein
MRADVIEFELRCREHGVQTAFAPVAAPRPTRCSRCLAIAESRREVRRLHSTELPVSTVAPEVWIG